jgi:hypothetical protein
MFRFLRFVRGHEREIEILQDSHVQYALALKEMARQLERMADDVRRLREQMERHTHTRYPDFECDQYMDEF